MRTFAFVGLSTESPIRRVLEIITTTFGGAVVTPEEAEVVVALTASDCLTHLKAGKQVVQFLADLQTSGAATGLLSAPQFHNRFRIIAVVPTKDYPGAEALIALIQEGGKEAA